MIATTKTKTTMVMLFVMCLPSGQNPDFAPKPSISRNSRARYFCPRHFTGIKLGNSALYSATQHFTRHKTRQSAFLLGTFFALRAKCRDITQRVLGNRHYFSQQFSNYNSTNSSATAFSEPRANLVQKFTRYIVNCNRNSSLKPNAYPEQERKQTNHIHTQ